MYVTEYIGTWDSVDDLIYDVLRRVVGAVKIQIQPITRFWKIQNFESWKSMIQKAFSFFLYFLLLIDFSCNNWMGELPRNKVNRPA